MVEERMGDGLGDNKPVLADVSNQFGKRKFLSISSGYGIASANQERGEDVVTGKLSFPGNGKVGVKDDLSASKVKQFVGSWKINSQVGTERLLAETSGISILNKCSMLFGHRDVVKKSAPESGNRLEDDKKDRVSLLVGTGKESDEETDSDTLDGSKLVSNTCASSNRGVEASGFASNRFNPIAASILSAGSKETKPVKCEYFNFENNSNASTGTNLLKTCSCSFCLKAAHIWSDLHYQDTKSRVSALKKSRRHVRSVIDKSSSYGGFGKAVLGTSSKPTKLENDLMAQWRSLFLHTEAVLIHENSQLESDLSDLKELRDKCKSNLETISMKSSNG